MTLRRNRATDNPLPSLSCSRRRAGAGGRRSSPAPSRRVQSGFRQLFRLSAGRQRGGGACTTRAGPSSSPTGRNGSRTPARISSAAGRPPSCPASSTAWNAPPTPRGDPAAGGGAGPAVRGGEADVKAGRAEKAVRELAPSGDRHEDVEACCRHFERNLGRMRHDAFRERRRRGRMPPVRAAAQAAPVPAGRGGQRHARAEGLRLEPPAARLPRMADESGHRGVTKNLGYTRGHGRG